MTKSVKSSLRAITRNRLAIGAAEREAVPKLSVIPPALPATVSLPRMPSVIACRFVEKLMKWIFSLLILMTGSVAFAGEAGLQESVPTVSETATVGRSANDVLSVLAKRLSLTDDQKSKILPIIIERRRKIQEVQTSSTLFLRQKMGQVRGINEDSDRRINALLTGDQQKAYAALEQERKVQRRIRRSQSEPTTN